MTKLTGLDFIRTEEERRRAAEETVDSPEFTDAQG